MILNPNAKQGHRRSDGQTEGQDFAGFGDGEDLSEQRREVKEFQGAGAV